MKNSMLSLKNLIAESESILILTHASPDGDALGSSASLKLMLSKMGKQADCLIAERFPVLFPHLEQYFTIQESTSREYDLVILVDCATKERTSVAYPKPKKIACIDHHISNTAEYDVKILDPDAAATAELMFMIMNEWKIMCDSEIAAAIYTGILTDTGGFLFQNTTEKTHRIVADLLKFPFDRNYVVRKAILEKSMVYSALYAHLFSTLTHYPEKKAVIGVIDYDTYQKYQTTSDDTEGLSGALRNIRGIECGVLLTEKEKGTVKGSIRTNETYNANELASLFGGGGHIRAAGFRTQQTVDEIKEKIYEWLSAHQ